MVSRHPAAARVIWIRQELQIVRIVIRGFLVWLRPEEMRYYHTEATEPRRNKARIMRASFFEKKRRVVRNDEAWYSAIVNFYRERALVLLHGGFFVLRWVRRVSC